jgi:hypothetical protein
VLRERALIETVTSLYGPSALVLNFSFYSRIFVSIRGWFYLRQSAVRFCLRGLCDLLYKLLDLLTNSREDYLHPEWSESESAG